MLESTIGSGYIAVQISAVLELAQARRKYD